MNSQSPGNELAGRRVFIVEDEAMVTMFLQDILADIGCEVAGVAFRLDDAVAKAASESFDVAILDVNLNGQNTRPVAEALAGRGVGFVFATGYGAPNIAEPFRNAPVLQKPFQQQDLERALRKALGMPGR